MTSQEYQLLQDFLNQLVQARGTVKDPEAEALITKAVAAQPDAAYLLIQRAMLLEQALNSAKTQITQLQNQASLNTGNGSFLSSSAWGNAQSQPPVTTLPSPPPSVAPPVNTQPGFFNSSGGSFLGTMAATAAGVAGGAFLFQGIGNLLGHHGNNESQGQNTAHNEFVDNTANHHNPEDNNDSSSADDSLDNLGPSDDDFSA